MINIRFLVLAVLATLTLGTINAQDRQHPLTTGSDLGIPLIGFGTWNLEASDNATAAVSLAIQYGYRHIDCAEAYDNEKEVGKGIADGLKKVGLTRKDIWITSKLWNSDHTPDRVPKALDKILSDLDIEYLDLFHMHWPVASSPETGNTIDYLPAWDAMMKLQKMGKTRHIGVSNFAPSQLANLIQKSKTKPSVHQFETHPYLQQEDFLHWHKTNGIHVTAYSPFADTNPTYSPPGDGVPRLLSNPVLKHIAKQRGCTPAQVALTWGFSIRGTSVIPKSKHATRIKENLLSQECHLTADDVEEISKLGDHPRRFNNPGKSWGVKLYEGLEDSG